MVVSIYAALLLYFYSKILQKLCRVIYLKRRPALTEAIPYLRPIWGYGTLSMIDALLDIRAYIVCYTFFKRKRPTFSPSSAIFILISMLTSVPYIIYKVVYRACYNRLSLYSALYAEVLDLFNFCEKTILIVDRGVLKINPGEEVLKDAAPAMVRLLSSLLFKPELARNIAKGNKALPGTAEKILYNLSLYTNRIPLNNQTFAAVMARHEGVPFRHPHIQGLFKENIYNTSNTKDFRQLMPSPSTLVVPDAVRPGILLAPKAEILYDKTGSLL